MAKEKPHLIVRSSKKARLFGQLISFWNSPKIKKKLNWRFECKLAAGYVQGKLPEKSTSTQMIALTCLKYPGARTERDQPMRDWRVGLASEVIIPLTKNRPA